MKTTLDDIVFANRHREYGAYELRKMQPYVLQKAFFIGICTFLALFLIPAIVSKLWVTKPQEMMKEYETTIFDRVPEKIPPKKIEAKPLPQLKTIRYTEPVVTQSPKIEEITPPVEDLEEAIVSDKTQDGTITDAPIAAPLPVIPEKEIEKPAPATDPNEIVIAEVQPMFEGGMAAFAKFLTRNLRYPTAAANAGVQGRVFVQFIVEPDGQVGNITVLKGVGFGCDEEALRVMKLMPRWKPGLQSGRPVRTRFNVPIAFVLE